MTSVRLTQYRIRYNIIYPPPEHSHVNIIVIWCNLSLTKCNTLFRTEWMATPLCRTSVNPSTRARKLSSAFKSTLLEWRCFYGKCFFANIGQHWVIFVSYAKCSCANVGPVFAQLSTQRANIATQNRPWSNFFFFFHSFNTLSSPHTLVYVDTHSSWVVFITKSLNVLM